jgi:hypothetical protein
MAAAYLWKSLAPVPLDSPRDLLGTLVSLASIVVGFLATAMSIIVAAPDSALIRDLRSSGYINDLIWYLKEPFLAGIALAAIGIAGYFLTPALLKSPIFLGGVVFLTSWLLAALCRVALVFMNFLRASAHASKENQNRCQTPGANE